MSCSIKKHLYIWFYINQLQATFVNINIYIQSVCTKHWSNRKMRCHLVAWVLSNIIVKLKILDKQLNPYSFTKFASNATFLSCWISSECMFTTETRTQWAFLKRIIDLIKWGHARKYKLQHSWPANSYKRHLR